MKKRYIVAAGLIGTIAAGTAVYRKLKKNRSENVILFPICRVTMHTSDVSYEIEELTKKCEVLVRGIVDEISMPKWNNKENLQPQNITNKDVIYKDYKINIDKIFKGDLRSGEHILLRSFEGELNGFTVEDNSQVKLEASQEIYAFLMKDTSSFNKNKEHDYYVPFGAIQGVFIIEGDRVKSSTLELGLVEFENGINAEL